MILYPAIDLKDGQCVRVLHGDLSTATVFNTSPAAQAASFVESGFHWVHVVDLSAALEEDEDEPEAEAAPAGDDKAEHRPEGNADEKGENGRRRRRRRRGGRREGGERPEAEAAGEGDADQEQPVRQLFLAHGAQYDRIRVIDDWSGRPRVLQARRRPSV